MTHFKTYLSLFESKGRGLWVNEAERMCISQGTTTFRAYLERYPVGHAVVVNKKGNPLHFRSAEAAAKHLLTDTN